MTNDQAEGYLLLACKDLGISKEEAEELMYAMESNFNYYTEEEAKDRGFKWLYDK